MKCMLRRQKKDRSCLQGGRKAKLFAIVRSSLQQKCILVFCESAEVGHLSQDGVGT